MRERTRDEKDVLFVYSIILVAVLTALVIGFILVI